MWEGQTCVILASGPSMSKEIAELVRFSLFRTIAINTTFRLAPWADMLYAADAKWWNHPDNKDARAFQWLKLMVENQGESVDDVLMLKNTGVEGFDDDPTCLRTGMNSGYQALHVAAQAGCKRVLLCGFDMRSVKNEQHWHDRHPLPLRDHSDGIYLSWIRAFGTLAPILEKRGVEVWNCTPGSALKCFQIKTIEAAIDEARAVPDSHAVAVPA